MHTHTRRTLIPSVQKAGGNHATVSVYIQGRKEGRKNLSDSYYFWSSSILFYLVSYLEEAASTVPFTIRFGKSNDGSKTNRSREEIYPFSFPTVSRRCTGWDGWPSSSLLPLAGVFFFFLHSTTWTRNKKNKKNSQPTWPLASNTSSTRRAWLNARRRRRRRFKSCGTVELVWEFFFSSFWL